MPTMNNCRPETLELKTRFGTTEYVTLKASLYTRRGLPCAKRYCRVYRTYTE